MIMLAAKVAAAWWLVVVDASLNISLVPMGFTSEDMVSKFASFGGWETRERGCDKYIYSRMWDEACMHRRPPPGEVLPLLVTGTPYVGSRAVTEMFRAMGVSANHEAYGEMATVSSVHSLNDFVGDAPYPFTSEATAWWRKRLISNKLDYQNVFKPRYKYAIHVTRCPTRVVAALMGARAPVIRFLEAFTAWPRLRSRCASSYECDAPWRERLGWAISAFVARNGAARAVLPSYFNSGVFGDTLELFDEDPLSRVVVGPPLESLLRRDTDQASRTCFNRSAPLVLPRPGTSTWSATRRSA